MAVKNLCNSYYVEANTGITGQLLKWAANLFFPREESRLKQRFKKLDSAYNRYDQYEQQISPEELRMASVYAFLGPSPLASTQMGITPGLFHFQSPGGVEEVSIERDSFITAVFDNIQFAISQNIEFLQKKMDSNHSISIMGGITRNPVILQRFADLLGCTIISSTSFETTIQGLLVLCDIAAEKITSPEDLRTRHQTLNLLRKFNPRPSMTQNLSTKYETWKRLLHHYRN
jgi:sugar (pentulose or hexulose) kinase